MDMPVKYTLFKIYMYIKFSYTQENNIPSAGTRRI